MRLKSREKGKGKGRREERREDKVAIREGLTVTLKLNIKKKRNATSVFLLFMNFSLGGRVCLKVSFWVTWVMVSISAR